MPCSLAMDIVELALNLNQCEEIKNAIQQQNFSSIQELQNHLAFMKEKTQLKH
jgi:hypothetical protein